MCCVIWHSIPEATKEGLTILTIFGGPGSSLSYQRLWKALRSMLLILDTQLGLFLMNWEAFVFMSWIQIPLQRSQPRFSERQRISCFYAMYYTAISWPGFWLILWVPLRYPLQVGELLRNCVEKSDLGLPWL